MNYVEAKDMPYNVAGFAMIQVAEYSVYLPSGPWQITNTNKD